MMNFGDDFGFIGDNEDETMSYSVNLSDEPDIASGLQINEAFGPDFDLTESSLFDGSSFAQHRIWDITSTTLYTTAGTVLNVLILLVLCSGDPGDARSPTSLYLTHLALADLLMVISFPIGLLTIEFGHGWSDSQHKTACFWEHAARSMNACVSIYMLVLLSIDRYVAIVMSIKRNRVYEWARNIRKSIGKFRGVLTLLLSLYVTTNEHLIAKA